MDLVAFVGTALPPPPSSVLDVGCGAGHLARALDAAGYRVVAIDPEAPEGEIFRRTTLENLRDTGLFDVAVASYALHHIESLHPAVGQIADLLTSGGKLVVQEFGWDRVDGATADWYSRQDGGAHRPSLCWPSGWPSTSGYTDTRRCDALSMDASVRTSSSGGLTSTAVWSVMTSSGPSERPSSGATFRQSASATWAPGDDA